MRIAASIVTTLAVALLTACTGGIQGAAHAPPPGVATDRTAMLSEAGRAAACVDAVEAQADFAPLRMHSPDPASMSFANFSDESRPDQAERDLIRRFVAAIAPCRPQFQTESPEARLLTLTFASQERLYAELVAGQMSWGEFNRRTHELDAQAESDVRRLAAR